MRCVTTRPAPRCSRALLNSLSSAQPLRAAMRPASCSAGSRTPTPPSSSAVRPPLAQRRGRGLHRGLAHAGRGGDGGGHGAGPSASFQAVSAGRIRVAIRPGGVRATCTARAPSRATSRDVAEVCTQSDIGRATPSMSEVSGASCAR